MKKATKKEIVMPMATEEMPMVNKTPTKGKKKVVIKKKGNGCKK